MTRTILSTLALAFALCAAVAPTPAYADDPPSAKDMAAAKKAYGEGEAAFKAGRFSEAAEKFLKSYNLSKNPVLLYNVAVTQEAAGMEDIAVGYYKKFLRDAPADNGQRPLAEEKLAALEKKLGGGETVTPTGPGPKPTPDTTPKGPIVVKPAGTYAETDFQHAVVDAAPPGKPLDVTAYVPEDSGWVVTLNFRTAGEGKFTSKEMKWRYKELVARIPAPKMIGDAVQYYIEVKDAAGTVVTRSGKATSPNLVTIEAGASPRFYPDVTDDGDTKTTPAEVKARDESDDPLNGNTTTVTPDETTAPIELQPQTPTGNGFRDVGSSKFKYMKWGSTIATGALLGASLVFYIQAGRNATAIEDDTKSCGDPPCIKFDDTSAGFEDAGKLNDTLSKVTLGIGAVTAVVAGYYWYKSLTSKKRGERNAATASGSSPEAAWAITPAFGPGYSGASAVVEF